MPQATSSRPSGPPAQDSSKPWYVVNKHLSFLEPGGDFTIVCKDSSWNGKPNPNGLPTAFTLRTTTLEEIDVKFSTRYTAHQISDHPNRAGAKVFECQYDSFPVSLVLCAIYACEHEHLQGCKDWEMLCAALRIAVYWELAGARSLLFVVIMSLIDDPEWKIPAEPIDVTLYFADAAIRANDALSTVASRFRNRFLLDPEHRPIRIDRICFWCRSWVELGPDRGSELVNTLLDLVVEGVFEFIEA